MIDIMTANLSQKKSQPTQTHKKQYNIIREISNWKIYNLYNNIALQILIKNNYLLLCNTEQFQFHPLHERNKEFTVMEYSTFNSDLSNKHSKETRSRGTK